MVMIVVNYLLVGLYSWDSRCIMFSEGFQIDHFKWFIPLTVASVNNEIELVNFHIEFFLERF